MTLSEFISKWVCTDKFSMLDKQGSITFQGLTALFRFPSLDKGKEIISYVPLIEFDQVRFEEQLEEMDKMLNEAYRLDK